MKWRKCLTRTRDHRSPSPNIQSWIMTSDKWTRIIWKIIFGDNLATHLKSCSWYSRQLSFVEKNLFSILYLGCCTVKWWFLFCGVGVVISATAGLPSPPPAVPPQQQSVPLVVAQGMCPFPGPALCLWPFCLMRSTKQHVTLCEHQHFPLFPSS